VSRRTANAQRQAGQKRPSKTNNTQPEAPCKDHAPRLEQHSGRPGQAACGARGSSHRGDEANAESNNTGGGSDQEHKNQTKNTTADKSNYADGNAAPSPANDGGKMGDADNPV